MENKGGLLPWDTAGAAGAPRDRWAPPPRGKAAAAASVAIGASGPDPDGDESFQLTDEDEEEESDDSWTEGRKRKRGSAAGQRQGRWSKGAGRGAVGEAPLVSKPRESRSLGGAAVKRKWLGVTAYGSGGRWRASVAPALGSEARMAHGSKARLSFGVWDTEEEAAREFDLAVLLRDGRRVRPSPGLGGSLPLGPPGLGRF